MNILNDWKGTKAELSNFVTLIMESIQEDMDIRLGGEDMRKLFCEAMSRNTVINELKDTINFILEDDGE